MKINIYIIVFGVIAVLIIAAALSTVVFNQNLTAKNVSLASLQDYGPAPNIQGIAAWINSPALNISQLKGKVVLVDFWTYSCINCIRSIPHLNAWYNAYGNNGLVIIGVQTPEFQFEHNISNVESAVKQFGIKYPVAVDNNYSTWDAYGNEYWPADYLIDKNGNIRYVVFGEGNYNQTEQVIRELLENANYTIQPNFTDVPLGVNFTGIGSPEMYFGYAEVSGHGSYFSSNDTLLPNQTVNYSSPIAVSQNNTIYLAGSWYNAPYSMLAVNGSKIFLLYKAKNVNVVASGTGNSITIKLDGKNLNQSYIGGDVHISNGNATAVIGASRLYNIVNGTSYGWHTLEIDAQPGFRIYTFTFG
jgi:thiol-disulfide isomerase/thioredoxin